MWAILNIGVLHILPGVYEKPGHSLAVDPRGWSKRLRRFYSRHSDSSIVSFLIDLIQFVAVSRKIAMIKKQDMEDFFDD
jgi:hypothetical protein